MENSLIVVQLPKHAVWYIVIFGWGGSCNGYYVDGIFKLNSDKNNYDYPWLGVKDTNFNHHMRIITYK